MPSFAVLCFLCTVLVCVKPILSVFTLQGSSNCNEFWKEKDIVNRYIQTSKLCPQILEDINSKREECDKYKSDALKILAVGLQNKSPLRVYIKTSGKETLTHIIISHSPQRMGDELVAELSKMGDDKLRTHLVKPLSGKVTTVLGSLLSTNYFELAEEVFKKHNEFTLPPKYSKCSELITRVLPLVQNAYKLETLCPVYYINFDECFLTALKAGSSYVFAFLSTFGPSTSLLATYVISGFAEKTICAVGLRKLKEQLYKNEDVMFVNKAVEVVKTPATKTKPNPFLAEYCFRNVELVSLLEVTYYNEIKSHKTDYYILYGVVSQSGLRNLKLERNFGKADLEDDYLKFKKANTEWMKIARPNTVPEELLLTLASSMFPEKEVKIIKEVAFEKFYVVISNGNEIYEAISGTSIQSRRMQHSSVQEAVVQLNTTIPAWPFKNFLVQPEESIFG